MGSLGTAYFYQGDKPKSIDYYKQSLAIAKDTKHRDTEGNFLTNLGVALYKSGNLAAAEKTLYEGLAVRESLRNQKLTDSNKVSLFDTQTNTYHNLQRVLIAQNKTDAALEISERGRGRAFVELLASRLSTNPQKQSPTPPNITEIKQIAKQQNSTLIQYSIIYDEFKLGGREQTKESELYIWVIKPTGEVTFRKADLKPLWQKENTTLRQLVTTSRQSIGARGANFRGIDVSFNPDAPKAANKLKRLHELLIDPIADLLPKNPSARVTFIPQESLFLVPFPALQDKSGKYLIEKHTILTSPSIQVLELTRKQKQRIGKQSIQGSNILIVGNPTMPKIPPKIGEKPQQLTPLPGAEREAKAIAKLFGAKALTGNQATETLVTQRLSQARLIHLASHGIFDDVQGLNSGIALTPSSSPNKNNEKGDGLLTAGEILDLELNAELVVLSACDTGRGKITGDGVIGLSRSWISAGVPSVLVSLWSVPDAPTAELMTEFYQNLQNNPDKATALRKAMLKIMKQHPNPRDWAAFTLIGEAE
ncbi:TPR repeat-containing protein [Calothrix parasitica NIES-267]|uniref:TPR repeat-containing protein n=1 Tax=Calothrix parasitica NIES-267 TaxID=1973488 RepID=A0A1Z4LK26_9CYAN|nr:TPR repeat-containing protein [Calothrix parasitica NIES-267]